MPLGVELVIPRGVIVLKIVVSIVPAVDPFRANIEIVLFVAVE
jgi:hypothetical protein